MGIQKYLMKAYFPIKKLKYIIFVAKAPLRGEKGGE